MLSQQLFIDLRLVVKAFRVRLGSQAHEVMVTLEVFSEQDQMKARFFSRRACDSVSATATADVRFTPDDGLNPLGLHRRVERDGAKHVAVIGHRAGSHSQFGYSLGKRLNLYSAIQETVIGVQMQMYEVVIRHYDRLSSGVLFPLDGAWGFRANVVNDAVDSSYLGDNSR